MIENYAWIPSHCWMYDQLYCLTITVPVISDSRACQAWHGRYGYGTGLVFWNYLWIILVHQFFTRIFTRIFKWCILHIIFPRIFTRILQNYLKFSPEFSPEFSPDTYYTSFSQEFSPELSRILSNFHPRCTVIISPNFAPVPMKICEN